LAALKGVKGEILLVNNQSQDKSLEIAKKYQKEHPQLIHVLQCHTPGAAAVRNYGMAKAKGEYVWFIDADDYIAEDAIQKLLAKARQTEADMVMLGAKRLAKNGTTSYLSAVEADRRDTKSRFIRYGMGPWQVLIRRQWWLEHGFKFQEGMIHEDMELMSSLILYTDKFASVDEPLYFYCENPESVLHKTKFSPHIFDIFPALEGLRQKFISADAYAKYHDELEWFFIWNLLIDSAKDFAAFPEGKPGFKRTRQMFLRYFPEWRKNRFLREKSIKLKVRVRLNYYK
jgi:glycosyltransferase involved in cell wall biosynthesis